MSTRRESIGLIDRRYGAATLVLAALGTALSVLAHRHETFPLDREVNRAARALGDGFEPIAYVFNEFDYAMAAVLSAVAVVVLVWRRQTNLALVFALAGALRSLVGVLKALVDRPRPSGDFPALDVVNSASFPSGHTTTAVVFFGIWFLLADDVLPRRYVLFVRVLSVLGVALMATSRMWAGVHWFSDTYGALVWGSAVLALALALRPASLAACALANQVWRRRRPSILGPRTPP